MIGKEKLILTDDIIESVVRLASLGATPETLSTLVGISRSEYDELIKTDCEVANAVRRGKTIGAAGTLNVLAKMVEQGKSLDALKYHLALLDKDYSAATDKGSTVNIQNNLTAIRLPSVAEAKFILESDPSLLPSQESESL